MSREFRIVLHCLSEMLVLELIGTLKEELWQLPCQASKLLGYITAFNAEAAALLQIMMSADQFDSLAC